MHFLTYLVLDQRLMLSAILADVTKRPFIIAGRGGARAARPAGSDLEHFFDTYGGSATPGFVSTD